MPIPHPLALGAAALGLGAWLLWPKKAAASSAAYANAFGPAPTPQPSYVTPGYMPVSNEPAYVPPASTFEPYVQPVYQDPNPGTGAWQPGVPYEGPAIGDDVDPGHNDGYDEPEEEPGLLDGLLDSDAWFSGRRTGMNLLHPLAKAIGLR